MTQPVPTASMIDDIHTIPTPFYLIDSARLQHNMQIMQRLRTLSGAKVLLALKCFATWSVFDLMREAMDGTTSSSLNEVRLGKEQFGGETHAYSVAYSDAEIDDVIGYGDKIIFNSASQLARFGSRVQTLKPDMPIGLRLNPQISSSSFDLADPARPFSRLGESDINVFLSNLPTISGVMIHNNCENRDFDRFDSMLADIEARYSALLHKLDWVSLGGGIHFTAPDYPLEQFAQRLRDFSQTYGVQIYLEPGEASITQTTTLHTTVLDVLHNQKDLAIVDSATEAHALDLLIYRESAALAQIGQETVDIAPSVGEHHTLICGKSCLAGDIFGEYDLGGRKLAVGERVAFANMAGYTMVKKNWFNGVAMPAIVIRHLDGRYQVVRQFGYEDFKHNLS